MSLPKSLLYLLVSVVIPTLAENVAYSQEFDENNFTRFTKQQGLSNDVITSIAQDSIGHMWISTASGLNRFSGCTFVQYHNSNDSLSLPSEEITGMTWLDCHRLAAWANGLHIINTRTGETKNLFVPYSDKQYQYKFNWIMGVASDQKGNIFMVTRSGFYQFDKNWQIVFRYEPFKKEEVSTSYFGFGRSLLQISDEEYIILSMDGMFYYNAKTRLFKKAEAADYPILAQFIEYKTKTFGFYQVRAGSFLITDPASDTMFYVNVPAKIKTFVRLPIKNLGDEFNYRSTVVPVNDTLLYMTSSESGFYKLSLNPGTGVFKFYPKKYFPLYYCRRLMEDRDHILWIATDKGLFRQDNIQLHIRQAEVPASLRVQFPRAVIQAIYTTSDKIFVAEWARGGLLEFDKKTFQLVRRYSFEKYSKLANSIISIISANDTALYIAGGDLYRLNLKTGHVSCIKLNNLDPGDWIADMIKDKKNNLWVVMDSLYKGDLAGKQWSTIRYDTGCYKRIESAKVIKVDASGNIWLGGHGLIRYNTSLNRFDKIIDSFPFIKIPDRQVNSLLPDDQNNLWFNSNNNGLICYNIDKGTFLHITRDQGLPDNNIASMMVIGSKLWLATFSGIACIDIPTLRITSFSKEDGFPDYPITINSKLYYDEPERKLYIGFSSVLVQFDPNIIFQKSKTPHLFIESLTTGDQKKYVFPPKNITTSWKNDEITVTIGSINYFTSSGQRFAYRLVKADSSQWQQLGEQNTFSISSLSSGYHEIQVKLFSINNRWPEQVLSFGITITPPFWEQKWFIIISALLLVISVYLLFKWRANAIRRKERAQTHIQKLKAEEYKNQFELEQISNYFSSSLDGKKSVDDVLWDVTENLIGRMNYEDCIIYMWNKEKTKMVQKAAYGPKGNPQEIENRVFDVVPGQGVVGHVILTKEPLLVPDTRKDSRYRVDEMVRLCELCVPIIRDNELIGIIDSEHHIPNYFKERDLKILTTIATLVGNKIKQLESEQSLEIKQKEISFINQQLAEAQLSALQTQMNPHFIFNSLNSIKGMILLNDQAKASRYLSKFANMIRMTLNQSKEMFTTLHENIEYLECYLMMEKLRFDDTFSYRITVDDDIEKEETLIPTLMIQPLTENAIWHGLLLKKGRKKLWIRFTKMDETISCLIEDNGIGINMSEEQRKLSRPSHKPVGLTNLRNRIAILNEKYDTGCTLDISDLEDEGKGKTGTCAVLRFNILTNQPNV